MKKIQSLILALPLIVAAAFMSCSDNNDDILPTPQPEQKAIAFIATIPETRVSYTPDGNVKVKCDWEPYIDEEHPGDVGKPVVLHGDNENYNFKITDVTYDSSKGKHTATIKYDDTKVFPDQFNGTATFVVGTGEQVQGKVTPTTVEDFAYLGNGVAIEADVNVSVPYDNPIPITFSHKNTAIFRVTFKSPDDFAAGAKLRINANGYYNLGEVTLNFPLENNGTDYTAYVRCTTTTPKSEITGEIDKIDQLTFVLVHPGSDSKNSHVCRKFYNSISSNSKTANGLEAGKYYYTDITEYTLTNDEIDPNTNEKKIWYEQETAAANVIGYAPLTVWYFPIPLKADHQYAEPSDDVAYYLYVGHDLLREKTETAKVQKHDDRLLYFQWGCTNGYTASDDVNNMEDIYGYGYWYNGTKIDGSENPFSTPTSSFYYTGETPFSDINEKVSTITSRYTFDDNSNPELICYYLNPQADAASYSWKGGWRMMSYDEAHAFLKATTHEKIDPSMKACPFEYDEYVSEYMGSESKYKGVQLFQKKIYEYKYTRNGVSIKFPTTGCFSGSTIDFSSNTSNDPIFNFYSWLRQSTPQGNYMLMNAMVLVSTFNNYDNDSNDKYVPKNDPDLTDAERYFHPMELDLYQGSPVLPALIVNASTGEADF